MCSVELSSNVILLWDLKLTSNYMPVTIYPERFAKFYAIVKCVYIYIYINLQLSSFSFPISSNTPQYAQL